MFGTHCGGFIRDPGRPVRVDAPYVIQPLLTDRRVTGQSVKGEAVIQPRLLPPDGLAVLDNARLGHLGLAPTSLLWSPF